MNESGMPTAAELHSRGSAQVEVHNKAASLTRDRFGNHVFVRGVVEISNYCRENCAYCGMRRSNRQLKRYRATLEQLAELLIEHRPETVTDVNIQAGEDPVAVRDIALPLIRIIRDKTNLGVSVCLGLHDKAMYSQ